MITPRPIVAATTSVGHAVGAGLAGAGDAAVLREPFDMARPIVSGSGGGERWVDVTWAFPSVAHVGGSGAEQRRSGGDAPGILVAFATGAGGQLAARDDAPAHVAAMLRAAHSMAPAPLWSDKSPLTSAAVYNPGDQRLVCATANRMFFVGGRVALIQPVRGRIYGARWRTFTIKTAGVLSDQLKVNEDIDPGDSWPAGSIVVPLFDAQPIAEETLRLITGRLGAGERAYRSADPRLYASALPALLADSAAPASPAAATYDGLPIFDLWPEWSGRGGPTPGVGVRRSIGDGALEGDRAALTFEASFVFATRADARRLLAWFAGRRGRTHPFWFVTPLRAFEIAGTPSTVSGTSLTVLPIGWRTRFGADPDGPSMPWPLDRIAVVVRDAAAPGGRAVYIRRITAAADTTVGGIAAEALTLDSALPTIATNLIDRVAWAAKGRFDQDEITERWLSTTVCRAGVRIVEVINEKTVEVGIGAACPAAQPQDCGCASGGGDYCSGHPAREGALTLAPGASPELTACSASSDGFVLAQSGGGAPLKIRLSGFFRGEDWECCAFSGGNCTSKKLRTYASARWDAEISVAAPNAHFVQQTNVTLATSGALVVKDVYGEWGGCVGPTAIPAGTAGVLKASVHWRYASGRRFWLIEMRGFKSDGTTEVWRMSADVDATGAGTAGGFFGGSIGLLPGLEANWDIRATQPRGFTGVAARVKQIANGNGFTFVDGEMSAYLCPVYRCS